MPRRSASDLAVVRVDGGFARLRPPPELSEEESSVWQDIVLACDAKHFQKSDAPLLVRYCQNVCLARRAARELAENGAVLFGRASAWMTIAEKADRAMVALSLRLRISPQARMRPETTKTRTPGSPYELMDD
jgi:phage terminase small subunit